MANVTDTPPTGSWQKSFFTIMWAVMRGIGDLPIGTFAIGDTRNKSRLWTKKKL